MDFPLAASSFGEAEKKAIQEVVDSDRYTMGPRVAAFEQRFAQMFGAKYAVMVNSGSSANLLAVASLFYTQHQPLQRGDEVIVPCIGWSTTFAPLHQYGLKLVFVDIDRHTLNLDVTQLEAALSPRTRAVVAVNILGNPCDFNTIQTFCNQHHLVLLEDNCESMGATYNGSHTGTFGDLGTFSTFFSHHISTMEGGMILTDDQERYALLKCLRSHGWSRDQDPNSPIFQSQSDDAYEAYRFLLPGYNLRPTEMSAALGLVQIDRFPQFIQQRRANAAVFQSLFNDHPSLQIQQELGQSSWFSFAFIPRDHTPNRAARFAQLKAAGIEHRVLTGGNILRHDVARFFDHRVVGRAAADVAHDRGFFVGNHGFDLTEQLHHLRRVLT